MGNTKKIDVQKIKQKAEQYFEEILEQSGNQNKNKFSKLDALDAAAVFILAARKAGLTWKEVQKELKKRLGLEVSLETLNRWKKERFSKYEELGRLYRALRKQVQRDPDHVDMAFCHKALKEGYSPEQLRGFLLVARRDTRKREKLFEYVQKTIERAVEVYERDNA